MMDLIFFFSLKYDDFNCGFSIYAEAMSKKTQFALYKIPFFTPSKVIIVKQAL